MAKYKASDTYDIPSYKKFFDLLQKEYKELNALHKQFTGAKGQSASIKNTTTALKELNAETKRREKIVKSLDLAEQKKIANEKADAKAVRDLARAEVRYERAAKGSLEQMRSSLIVLKLRHKEMVVGTKREIAYRNKILQTTNALKRQEAAIGVNTRNVGNYGSALGKATAQIGNFVKGFGLMAAAYAGFRIAKESIELFKIQEQAVADNITVFGEYSKVIQKAAAENQKFTTVGDEQYIQLATSAGNLGIEVNKVLTATEGAIGLSEKFKKVGLGQETALKGIANAYVGNFSQLERYIPALRDAETEAEKMAILQKEMAFGMDLAREAAKTSGGQIEQFKNEMGDLKEQIGKGIIPIVLTFIEVIKQTIKDFKPLGEFVGLMRDIGSEIKNNLSDEQIERLERVGSTIKQWGNALKLPLVMLGKFTTQLRKALVDLGILTGQAQGVPGLNRHLEDNTNQLNINTDALIENNKETGKQKTNIDNLTKSYDDYYASLNGKDEKGIQDITDDIIKLSKAVADAGKEFDSVAGVEQEITLLDRIFGTPQQRQQVQSEWNTLYGTLSQITGNFYDALDNRKDSSLKKDKRRRTVQKGLDITNATINTYLAATGVLAQTSGGIVARAIATALTIALGLSQVAKIASTKYRKGTEFLHLNGAKPGIDTIPAIGADGSPIRLHQGEGIVTQEINSKLGGFPYEKLPIAVKSYREGIFNNMNNNMKLERLMQEQTRVIRNKRDVIQKGDVLIVVKDGKPTGEKFYLSQNV